MKIQEIIEELEKTFPLSLAEAWDNSGLQAGWRDKEVKKVFVALDATMEAIREASEQNCGLMLTHHPLLMEGIKSISDDTVQGRKLMELLQRDITHYAMHTNFDIAVMGELSAERLRMENTEPLSDQGLDVAGVRQGFGRVGYLPRPMKVREAAEMVKTAFNLKNVKVFGDLDVQVQRAAILPGSGKSMVSDAVKKKAEVMISGDFGHHDGLDAVEMGLIIIDAGHYGLEHIFMGYMEGFIGEHFPDVEVCRASSGNPFEVL